MDTYCPLVAKVTGTVEWADGTTTGFTIIPEAGAGWFQNGENLNHYSLGEVFDKWSDALCEYQVENTPTHHYHVGANIPGYLPEGDVLCFVDVDEAREALKSNLERASDALPDCTSSRATDGLCGDESCVGCTSGALITDYITEIDGSWRDTSVPEFDLSYDVHDGRSLPIRHWLTYWPADDCEVE